MNWVLDKIYGSRLKAATDQQLRQWNDISASASRSNATAVMDRLSSVAGRHLLLGRTRWDRDVRVPMDEMLRSHGLVTGGSGAGKTRFGAGILASLIDHISSGYPASFGVLDGKGDLLRHGIYLVGQRIAHLQKTDPAAAKALRQRVVIVDFGSSDPVSSYNLLVRWAGSEPDFFAWSRAETLMDLC